MRKILIYSAFIFAFVCEVFSQNGAPENEVERQFVTIAEWIETGQYRAAAKGLNTMQLAYLQPQQIEKQRYLLALLSLRQQKNVNLMIDVYHTIDNPTIRTKAGLDIANHYFDKKDWKTAIIWYDDVNVYEVPVKSYGAIRYRQAYAKFETGKWEVAGGQFLESALYGGDHTTKAYYYAGVVTDSIGEKSDALEYFLKASADPELVAKCAPYVAAIYQNQKAYDQAQGYIAEMMPAVSDADKIILLRLSGDIYFQQKDFANCRNRLQQSLELSKGKAPADIFFKLAFSYEKLGESAKAIANYRLAALEKSEMGQLAAFQLGYLYVASGDFVFAVRAFDEAAKPKFNLEISEVSTFLGGKTWVQAANYQDAITQLNFFIKEYPNSKYTDEARELLVQAYFQTSNYDAALTFLKSIPRPDANTRLIHQRIAYIKGRQLFNDRQYASAKQFLLEAIKLGADQEVTGLSLRILGDCQSIDGAVAESITSYQQAASALGSSHPEYALAAYGLAYAHFQQANYTDAIRFFGRVLEQRAITDDVKRDATVRLADCHFMAKDYTKAATLYQSILKGLYHDYALLQLGLIYYLQSNVETSAGYFNQLLTTYPTSYYADNALIQLANLWFENARFEEALKYYTEFESRFSSSNVLPYARLGIALCQENLGRNEQAAAAYISVLDFHIQHKVAGDALLGLQGLVLKGYQVEGIDDYLEQLNRINPNNQAVEVLSFEQAKGLYFNQKYVQAITGFKSFVSRFPDSPFYGESLYYMGDSYLREGDNQNAIAALSEVTRIPNHSFVTRSLERLGRTYLSIGDWQKSISAYQRLLGVSANRRDTYNARQGLMQTYFTMQRYDSATFFAELIRTGEWAPLHAATEASLIVGKSNFHLKRYDRAYDAYIEVMNSKSGEYASEAFYRMAELQFAQKEHVDSRETLLQLISNYGAYPIWTDQAYMLLVDNYIAVNEVFQAKATLNSIIDKSKNEALVARARVKLREVNELENRLLEKPDTVKR